MDGLTKLFDGFTFIFAPALVLLILGGILALTWTGLYFVDQIIEGFRMGAALNRPAVLSPVNAVAADAVIRERERQDKLRRERLRSLKFDNNGPATRTAQTDLAGIPSHLKYLDNAGEIDITAEVFQTRDETYLIASDPLGTNPSFFHSILKGRATEKGVRDVRFHYTPVRSLARRMTIAEANALLPHLPKNRSLFIVNASEKEIEKQVLSKLRPVTGFSPAVLDAT